MDEILERLNQFIVLSGKTINQITELADLSSNTIYNWFKRKAEPTIHALQAVCRVLDIDVCDLFSERRDDFSLSPNEIFLVNSYKKSTETQKRFLLELAKEFSEKSNE